MQYWKAHYKDALHDADIRIINAEDTAEPLSFTLDGIRFQGASCADFHLAEEAYYDEAVLDFSLLVDELCYESSRKSLYFEDALRNICTQMKDNYLLKCCFTCQYSDYSPYGNDDYGAMLCYRRYKEDCLKVNNKEEYFLYLEGKDCDMRQETYLCGQYHPRSQAGGYRGFVDGARDLQKEGEKDEQTGNL